MRNKEEARVNHGRANVLPLHFQALVAVTRLAELELAGHILVLRLLTGQLRVAYVPGDSDSSPFERAPA